LERKSVFLLLVLLSLSIHGQSISRVEVKGLITSNDNDVEGITVFNTSSNKGTITNTAGEFTIKVGLNDIIEIAALQFQAVSVIVDAEVIQSKQLKIYLAEHINQLDAVLLSSGLSGNIETDITNAKTVKPIVVNMGNMNVDFEYNDDKAFDNSVVNNHLTSILDPNARNYLPDLGKILKLIFKKNPLIIQKKLFIEQVSEKHKDILDIYSHKFISETCNLPVDKAELFIAYIEAKGIKNELYRPENEIYLIEFLVKQSKAFLKLKDAKH